MYLFFFNIKRFHLHALERKNYIFYVVFGIEFVFVLVIIYGLYALIVPSATIEITPTYQVEDIVYNFRYYPATDKEYPQYTRYLSIPFYSGYIDYKYELSISANNIRHIQHPSAGTVTIYNPTSDDLSLIANTRFVTNDGVFFKAANAFTIPSGTAKAPGKKNIRLIAMDFDEQNTIIGTRGNISSGTQLWIKNITKSFFTKEIYAKATENFSG